MSLREGLQPVFPVATDRSRFRSPDRVHIIFLTSLTFPLSTVTPIKDIDLVPWQWLTDGIIRAVNVFRQHFDIILFPAQSIGLDTTSVTDTEAGPGAMPCKETDSLRKASFLPISFSLPSPLHLSIRFHLLSLPLSLSLSFSWTKARIVNSDCVEQPTMKSHWKRFNGPECARQPD